MLLTILLVAAGAVIAAAAIITAVLISAEPLLGEAPEDSGSDWDAGVQHVCWHCDTRVSGPADGMRIRDCECWDCHCARYVPGDDVPTVGSWVRKPETATR